MMTTDEPIWEELRGNNPPPKKRRSRKHLEKSVLRECRNWLVSRDEVLYVERRNTGAIQFEDRFVPFGVPGGADLWCLIQIKEEHDPDPTGCYPHLPQLRKGPINHIEIECKRRDGKGRMSDAQKKFQARCSEIGVPYFVVTSAEDLEQQLKEAELS